MMETIEQANLKKQLDLKNAWKEDDNLRIQEGTKRDVRMWEQDNILDYFVAWCTNNSQPVSHLQALKVWYTQKNVVHKDNAAPIEFVENGQGWKLLNQLHRLINTQAFNDGFDQGLVRGRQEIIEKMAEEKLK